jgi:cysteinyl-tRNA synthetase
MGCSRRLKELKPEVRVIAVEPQLDHKLQGLKSLKEAYVPGIFDKRLVDEKIEIADEDAFETTRRLVKAEGMLLGMSSGAAVFVALELAKDLEEGVMVLILPDFGERYLSTDLFTA